jgi:hypothetical protein
MDILENNLNTAMPCNWKWKNLINDTTWNIHSMCHKDDKLEDNLLKKNIRIGVISETMRKQQYTKETHHYINHSQVEIKTVTGV